MKMFVKLVLVITVLCAVIIRTKCERSYQDGRPFMQYTRIKRGKYNSGPPRIYSRPPTNFLNKGVFSYTPPPNYMIDGDGPLYPGNPGNSRPPKVSKRPTNEGLGDEDINNIVKYLSKQDLDKIIEFAGAKDKDSDKYKEFEQHIEYSKPPSRYQDDFKSTYTSLQDVDIERYAAKGPRDDESKIFKEALQEIDTVSKFIPFQEPKPFSMEYNKPSIVTEPTPLKEFYSKSQNNQIFLSSPNNPIFVNSLPNNQISANSQTYANNPFETEESMLKSRIAHLTSHQNGDIFTDSKDMPEENLPKPMNLREEPDFDVSYTNNVPTIVKAEPSSSYKLENFGVLPLMEYISKLDTQSSYRVPHYTVTSSQEPSSSFAAPASSSYSYSSSKIPSVEPAPPSSVAKEQSDAHLKAVRIWSHKSKGTAYTLHDDGTLSLEKPSRPKGIYGYP